MEEKELIHKIKALKKIQPDTEWVVSCRTRITQKINANEVPGWGARLVAMFSFDQPLFRPALTFAILVVLVGVGGLAIFDAQNSLPGENAFLLKVFMERAERQVTALTADEAARVQLGAEITDRRTQELAQILNGSSAPREDQVKEAVDQIQLQVASAKDDVSKLKARINAANSDPQKIAAAVTAIKESNEKVKQVIANAQGNLPENLSEDKTLASKISDISDITTETNNQVEEIIDSVELMSGDIKIGNGTASSSDPILPKTETTTSKSLSR
jgi:hypothetical protein